MLPSPALYFTFLAICAGALAYVSFRADRILGWLVVFALFVNFTGAGLMGWWVQRVHGREYSGGDEVSYQWDGSQILRSWRTKDTSYVRSTVGIFAPINAVVIAVAGPGYTPMRLTTALVGAIGVSAAFWLTLLLYGSVATARVAALLCATSPLLILFSWSDMRERWIATSVLLVLVAGLLTTRRPTWRRALGLAAAVWILTSLRHYWGTLLGNLMIAGSLLFGASRWPRRVGNAAIVAVAVGMALWMVTETFLGLGIRHETVVKYVTVPPEPGGAPSAGAFSPSPAEPGGSAAGSLNPEGPFPPVGTPRVSRPQAGAVPLPGEPDITRSSPAGAARDVKAAVPYSGPTLGVSTPAQWESAGVLLRNLSFVLFGRVHGRADGGRFASLFLLPEGLWSFLLVPLAVAGVLAPVWRGQLAVLIPAAYVGTIMLVLSWLHGDEWSTYRFRNLYWPVLLILVAGGITWVYDWWGAQRRSRRVEPAHQAGTRTAHS